jgi:hypothetical protein
LPSHSLSFSSEIAANSSHLWVLPCLTLDLARHAGLASQMPFFLGAGHATGETWTFIG